MATKTPSIKAVIGPVRFSYLHIFEPHSFDADKEPRYSATLLIPKSDTKLVEAVKSAINSAYGAAVETCWGSKKPPIDKVTCLRDGDEPNADGEDRGEAYHDCYYLTAKSIQQPGIVDKARQPIIDPDELYSGCWGYVSVGFRGFDNNGNKGISCFLNNVMKTKAGEPLGTARTSAADDFANVDFGEDDDL